MAVFFVDFLLFFDDFLEAFFVVFLADFLVDSFVDFFAPVLPDLRPREASSAAMRSTTSITTTLGYFSKSASGLHFEEHSQTSPQRNSRTNLPFRLRNHVAW